MRAPAPQTRSLTQIEAQLDEDRATLARSVTSLRATRAQKKSDRVGALGLPTRVKACADAVGATILAYPVAIGMTAAGAAWLAFGRRGSPGRDASLAGTELEAKDRWADDGGPVPEVELWIVEADRLRDDASGLYAKIGRAMRGRAAPESDLTPQREDVLAALTSDVRRAMQQGLEGLSQSARDAAVAAREATYIARLKAAEASAQAVGDRPFASGAVLAAAGAAAAWILPQSKGEVRFLKGAANTLLNAGIIVLGTEGRRISDVAITLADVLIGDLQRMHREVDEAAKDIVSPRPAKAM